MTQSTQAVQTENLTQHFLTHLIDAASMRTDIDNLKSRDSDFNMRMIASLDAITAELKALSAGISHVPRQISECRLDMRHEVERDFPSKVETLNMERRIEDKIGETDKTLGTQIAAVNTKLSGEMQELKAAQVELNTKFDKQWLKITVIVSTVVSIGMLVQWMLILYNVVGK